MYTTEVLVNQTKITMGYSKNYETRPVVQNKKRKRNQIDQIDKQADLEKSVCQLHRLWVAYNLAMTTYAKHSSLLLAMATFANYSS